MTCKAIFIYFSYKPHPQIPQAVVKACQQLCRMTSTLLTSGYDTASGSKGLSTWGKDAAGLDVTELRYRKRY